jgi:PAS domain-containing protein
MVRLAIGLTSLMLCLLFAAHALGLVPDRDGAMIAGRKALCEAMAIHCASLGSRPDDLASLEVTLAAIRKRNPDLESAGIRNAAGQLVMHVGDHETHWKDGFGPISTATHMHVPLALENKLWGTVELRFQPLHSNDTWNLWKIPVIPLASFVLVAGFGLTYLYLRGVLKYSDPKRAKIVPERVRDTLNTVTEGVLVLDQEERIAFANEAFARTVGQSLAELQGRKASALPWTQPRSGQPVKDYPWWRALRESMRASPSRCRSMRPASAPTTALAWAPWPPLTI